MVVKPFQQLSDQETEEVIRVLEEADENHRRWLRDLHASLICGVPFSEDVTREAAHTLCRFGRWYYRGAPEVLQDNELFVQIEDIHRRMHDSARQVAELSGAGQPVPVEVYGHFVGLQANLSRLLSRLRHDLQRVKYSYDSLTGALTREAFFPMLRQEFERVKRTGESCALCILDLDHFKSINDTYGHLGGDRALRRISRFIHERLRKYDSICRFGGEEFLLFLPEVNREQAMDIIERMRSELADTLIELGGVGVRLTASFGVTLLRPERSLEANLQRADRALYQAKGQGRDQVVFQE